MRHINRFTLLTTITTLGLSHTISAETYSIEELSNIVKEQKERIEELESRQEATAEAIETGTGPDWVNKISFGGYGEHHYNNKQGVDGDQIDAHRFVIFTGYQYSDTIRFMSELELEHSLAGDDKPGEVELEQAYIEWDYTKNHSVQFGLFLIPVGILNETHEPDTFYGTERNNVEKEVIPTTWWETGVMLTGEIAPGLSYNFAVHSGLGLDDGETRIRSGRQKSAEATADDFAFTGRLKYTGIAGLELSASLQYQEDISQGADTGEGTPSAILATTHLIYNSGPFGVRALYAQWDIDGSTFEDAEADSLSGFYIEPSYKLCKKLGVFARYSEWDKENDKKDLDSTDFGVNYWLHPQVVLKADYSDVSEDAGNDTFNLGVGWSY